MKTSSEHSLNAVAESLASANRSLLTYYPSCSGELENLTRAKHLPMLAAAVAAAGQSGQRYELPKPVAVSVPLNDSIVGQRVKPLTAKSSRLLSTYSIRFVPTKMASCRIDVLRREQASRSREPSKLYSSLVQKLLDSLTQQERSTLLRQLKLDGSSHTSTRSLVTSGSFFATFDEDKLRRRLNDELRRTLLRFDPYSKADESSE
jgi:hypothetical protein